MIISSTGLMVNQHFCQREGKSSVFILKLRPCCDHQAKSSSLFACEKGGSHDDEGNCCHTDGEFFKVTSPMEYNTQDRGEPEQQQILLSIPKATGSIQSAGYWNLHSAYHPPPIIFDRPVLFQSFLC